MFAEKDKVRKFRGGGLLGALRKQGMGIPAILFVHSQS